MGATAVSTTTVGAQWHHDALCAQTDPDAFFPEIGENPVAAKAVCRRCPVQIECLTDALAQGDRFGVWGGLSPRERRPHTWAPLDTGEGGEIPLADIARQLIDRHTHRKEK